MRSFKIYAYTHLISNLKKLNFNIKMLSIHCKKCNQLFGESFYFYFTNSSQLACKEVTIDNVLNKLTSNNNNEYKCIKCGSLVCKKQDLLLFQYNTIYFKEKIHGNLYRYKWQYNVHY